MSEITKSICTEALAGSITLKTDSGISVDMELTLAEPLADTDVIKLQLCSSADSISPINCGTAEISEGKFRLSGNFPDNSHIDTAEVIRKNVFTEETISLAKVCFAETPKAAEASVEYDIDINEIRQKLGYLQEHPAYKAYLSATEDLKSPVDAAAEALDKLHEVLSRMNEEDSHQRCMDRIRDIADEYETAADMPLKFQWYRITDLRAFSDISSFEHILNTPDVVSTFKAYGHYLLGITPDENVVCIAIPVAKDAPNPISHVDDCTVYIPTDNNMEYCTVCVSFEPDGQYFMPIC